MSAVMNHIGVGIDTARYGHSVTFLREDRQPAAPPVTILENHDGYQQLRQRLEGLAEKHPTAQFHIHLDAAGQYATNLERFLRSLPLPTIISIGEPKRNKDYHKAMFPKRTSDSTESHAMGRFAVVEQPKPTADVPYEIYLLREIAARLQGQIKDTTRAINRLHNILARVFPEMATVVNDLAAGWVSHLLKKYPTPKRIAAARMNSLKQIPYIRVETAEKLQDAARRSVGTLQGEVAELLVREAAEQLQMAQAGQKRLEKTLVQVFHALPRSGHVHIESIPGIGTNTAAVLVAKMISIDRFDTPERVVGYFGIFPEEDTSGVDRCGKSIPPGTQQMSRKGSDLVRRYLWNAAKSAIVSNPAVRELYHRLRSKGTRGDVALGHCMRKLLHQVFGVWGSDKPFDEKLSMPRKQQQNTTPEVAEKKRAAGHKRVHDPEKKVVTAANESVEPSAAGVKQSVPNAPGSVDYAHIRTQLTMQQLLSHMGWLTQLRSAGSGAERRGPCPLHGSTGAKSRSFSVNLEKNVYQCFHPGCESHGNALDLWKAYRNSSLYEAALELVEIFKLETKPGPEKRSP